MTYDENKYRPGEGRDTGYSFDGRRKTHLYEIGEDSMDFLDPMCRYGWNRDGGESYSILRNNVGPNGICKLCIKRASKGLSGVPSHSYNDYEDDIYNEYWKDL